MAGETSIRKPRSLLKDYVLWALAGVYLLIVLAFAFPGSDPAAHYFAIELYCLLPVLLIAMAAPWIGLPTFKSPAERLFWALWTVAQGAVLLVEYLFIDPNSFLNVSELSIDLGYVLFYMAIVMALQVKPDRRGQARGWRTHDLLEASGTGVFVLILLLYFVLIPSAYSPDDFSSWVPSLILYFSLDVFIFLTLLYLRQTCQHEPWRIVYTWLTLASGTWAITDGYELLLSLGALAEPATYWVDFIWYVPWLFFVTGARVRAHPVPALFGRQAGKERSTPVDDLIVRPGWLLIPALALPVIHYVANSLDLLASETRDLRESVVLVSLLFLLGLAFLHQRAIQRRVLALAKKKKEAEEFLRLLAAAVEQASDSMLITDAGGVIRYVNPAFEEAGGKPESVLGTPLVKAIPAGIPSAGDETLDEALASQKTWEGRSQTAMQDGSDREELVTVSPVRTPEGDLVHWVMVRKDVTYLAHLEREFHQVKKMEALGTLAGGIAHFFNNILGTIYGYGELIKASLQPGSEAEEDLQVLLSASERAAGLVKQILTYSRQGVEGRESIALQPAIGEVLTLLRKTLPSSIILREDIEDPEAFVWGSKDQIHQVIMNLGANATDAMAEDGGWLDVGLERVFVAQKDAEDLGLSEGVYSRITVRDSGTGMDEETLDRIFDPFFTTKGLATGTGLGLSVVHGAVTGHGGGIRVESEPGEGTRVEVFLPCTGQDNAAEEAKTLKLRPEPADPILLTK